MNILINKQLSIHLFKDVNIKERNVYIGPIMM